VVHRFDYEYWALLKQLNVSRRRLGRARKAAICYWCTKQAREEAKRNGLPPSQVPPVLHSPDDPLAGLPVFLDAFDYDAAVEWSWKLGYLWHLTITYLDRDIGKTQYAKVTEMQRRGLPHIHSLIAGSVDEAAIRRAIDMVNRSLPPGQGWGDQTNVQILDKAKTAGGVARYLSNYLTKDSPIGLAAQAAKHPHAAAHFRRLHRAAFAYASEHARTRPGGPCPTKGCSGRLVSRHSNSALLSCTPSRLGGDTCGQKRFDRLSLYTRQLGLRCHRLTKSHKWAIEHRESRTRPNTYLPVVHKDGTPRILTLTRIRQRRIDWCRRNLPNSSPGPWIRIAQPTPLIGPHIRPPPST
jgi:hypothetical protein